MTVGSEPVGRRGLRPASTTSSTAPSRGGGATCNGAALRVSVTPTGRPRHSSSTQAQSSDPAVIAEFARPHGRADDRRPRACASPAPRRSCSPTIAAGQLGGYCERDMDPWDVAAGRLLIEEAGGRLTDFDGRPAARPRARRRREQRARSTTSCSPRRTRHAAEEGAHERAIDGRPPLAVTTTGGWARPGWWDVVEEAEPPGASGPPTRSELYDDYCRAGDPRPGALRARHRH